MAELYTYYDALRAGNSWDNVEERANSYPVEQRRFVMSVSKIEKAFLEGLKYSVDEAFEELSTIQDSDIPSDWVSVNQAAYIRGCFLIGRVEELKLALQSLSTKSPDSADPRSLLLQADAAFIEFILIDQHFTLEKIGTRNRRFIHELLVKKYDDAMQNFGQHQLKHGTKSKVFLLAQPFRDLDDIIMNPPHEQMDFVTETLNDLTVENCEALLKHLISCDIPLMPFKGAKLVTSGWISGEPFQPGFGTQEQWKSLIKSFGGSLVDDSKSSGIPICESSKLSGRPALSFAYERLRLSGAAFCKLCLMFLEFMTSKPVTFDFQSTSS